MTGLLQWIRSAGLALLVVALCLATPAAAGTSVSPQGLTNATAKITTTATGTQNTLTDATGGSLTVGSVGTWLVIGTTSVTDSAGAATFNCEVWDGTTVASAAAANTSGASADAVLAMAGIATNPAGGILKLSCKDTTSGSGSMLGTGTGAPSQITAVRIG